MNGAASESVFDALSFVRRFLWVINPGEEPLQNVRVAVDHGIITEISDVPADEKKLIEPLALLPPLVNAHTHLEFSGLTRPLTPFEPFTTWIEAVIRYRRGLPDPETSVAAAVKSGLAECRQTGTRVLGEITTSDSGWRALKDTAYPDPTIVSFRELLGFTRDRLDDQVSVAREFLSPDTDASVHHGLSPHAPYSVHPDLFAEAIDLAGSHNRLVAMHLAETEAERELLDTQTGPFRSFLQSVNLWDSTALRPGTTPLRYLEKMAQLPRALAVHCNYLSAAEIRFLCEHPQIAVVYCPRTHASFGHVRHPWRQLRDGGATVVLGTDSRASNPDLSIWKELQHVATASESPAIWDLLPMITTDAAEALGFNPHDHTIHTGASFSNIGLACTADSQAALDQQLKQCEVSGLSSLTV